MNTMPKRDSKRGDNARWLREQMNPYFFVAMKDEPAALSLLTRELGTLQENRRLILADREKSLIMALVNRPGTLYETLSRLQEREISYAMIAHSDDPVPGLDQVLEIQRFEFDRRPNEVVTSQGDAQVPAEIRRKVAAAVRKYYPDFDLASLDRQLLILWLNNENYVRISPPRRIAQVLRLYQEANRRGGLYLDVEENGETHSESRVFFAVANPPQRDFLLQVMEVFNRLDLGVNRAYCLTVTNGVHPYFLGTFYVRRRDGGTLHRGSTLFTKLQHELSNTQILPTRSPAFRDFVTAGLMSGEEGTLTNVFTAFCHTNLAHNQPDRFSADDVRGAFHAHPEITLQLARLFRVRFDPSMQNRETEYPAVLAETRKLVEDYNTGHRYLDEIRRTIFSCCLSFITHTLKTNFFVMEKQALAFRLDPSYLAELGPDFTSDLPAAMPFRITFFFSRFGFGYHIGFSDIARGGWRTVISRTSDDFITNTNTLFRENFVLAHTQHFKNKDIYEGGSKMVVVMDATDLKAGERELETARLYKLQYGVASAFLDIFVTENGLAKHPAVVDYYREDEPIELGPDENMHDSMIEAIAALSRRRGYILGIGIMSSKKVGINHKEYGVTSTGVVKFAEITMREIGIDIHRHPFTVKFTGGTNGDVAGNAMQIMLERCPSMRITLILDGTAALFDPVGADHNELRRILLKEDLDRFDPEELHDGGFMLFRTGSRKDGLRDLFRKVSRQGEKLQEEWISTDDFSRQFNALPFTVKADLFIPAGGRPETIDSTNWERFFLPDGTPSARVIVEGANSFITPDARVHLQKNGIIVMRDASANKCGVISSSYEIIANLLLTEMEFLAEKERYVADVVTILEKRAEDEARLILKRRRAQPHLLCTEISDMLSTEINENYAKLFSFFQSRPELAQQPIYRDMLLEHLPAIVREEPRLRRRISNLPQKYVSAILAAEIGSSMVYAADQDAEFEGLVRMHVTLKRDQRMRKDALLPVTPGVEEKISAPGFIA